MNETPRMIPAQHRADLTGTAHELLAEGCRLEIELTQAVAALMDARDRAKEKYWKALAILRDIANSDYRGNRSPEQARAISGLMELGEPMEQIDGGFSVGTPRVTEAGEALEALRTFGVHRSDCPATRSHNHADCACGFAQAAGLIP